MSLASRLPPGGGPAVRPLLAGIAFGIAATILLVVQAYLLSTTIDAGFLGRASLASLGGLFGALAAVALLRGLCAWTADAAMGRAAVTAKQTLREALLARVVAVGPAGLADERTGELVNTLGPGVDTYDAYVGQYLPHAALALLAPIVVLGAVTAADPLSGLVLFLTWPLIPLFLWLIGGAARERSERQWAELSRLSARFLDAVQGMATLKAFGRSRDEATALALASERFRAITMGVLRVAFLSSLVLELLATLSVAIVAVEVGLRLLYARMAFQPALFVLILAPEFYGPLRRLGAAFHAGMAGRAFERRARALLGSPPPPGAVPASGRTLPFGPSAPPRIVFEDVTVTYNGGSQPALDRLRLEMPPGVTVALAGPSGAGKTTVASLLLRFTAPRQGRILVNGVPLDRLDLDAWRAAVAWVPQRPHLFHGTVADNLRLGRAGATRAEMDAALEAADAAGFVADLPLGLDTPIGEQGERLSGGQAQRLAIARALLRDAPVVVLDEPTSQLDPETDARAGDAIRRLTAGRTTLVIAHRRSTLRRADLVAVLAAGRVTAMGTPDALVRDGEPLAAPFDVEAPW